MCSNTEEFRKFNIFYTLEIEDEGVVKVGIYKSDYMTEAEYEAIKDKYRLHRVKPEQCSVVYTANGSTYIDGTILGINHENQYIPVGKANQVTIVYDIPYKDLFDFDKAKKAIDKQLFNPNRHWLYEEK